MASEHLTPSGAQPGDEAAQADFSSTCIPDLVDLVKRQLLQSIFEGQLPLGPCIVEAEQARQMGDSRAPLREVALQLEIQAVMVATPRKGFKARTFSTKEIKDLFKVRLGLEVIGARLACDAATDEPLLALKAYA